MAWISLENVKVLAFARIPLTQISMINDSNAIYILDAHKIKLAHNSICRRTVFPV